MDGREIASTTDHPSPDSAPLLGITTNGNASGRIVTRTLGLSRLFRMWRSRGSRRIMREPSALVRETAAEQLEERQNDWAYSRPVVVLDLLWNLAFVVVAVAVLIISRDESPTNPLRAWLVGYAAQCCIHMACVCVEYRRRYGHGAHGILQSPPNVTAISNSGLGTTSERSHIHGEAEQMYGEATLQHTSYAKRIESANTSFSFVWWVVGFYWTTTGSELQNAPLLFWLCVIFLAFDACFAIFCVSIACIIGIAVCCCLPCIIALMYALAEQEGASEEDITALPKFRFQRTGSFSKDDRDLAGPFGGAMSMIVASGVPIERVLPAEDAECCICLSSYEEGVELRELPCGHHFHCTCIDRWLRMNSTCPLCKYNVSKDNNAGREDV